MAQNVQPHYKVHNSPYMEQVWRALLRQQMPGHEPAIDNRPYTILDLPDEELVSRIVAAYGGLPFRMLLAGA